MDEDVFDVEIKNDKLEALIDWAFDNWDSNDISWSKMSNQEAGEKLISIFACDMLINAHKVGTKLDFTYDTLKNLPFAARRCLQGYMESGISFGECADSLARSLAAYIYCLSLNEHDCPWNVRQIKSMLSSPTLGPLWGGALCVTTGVNEKKDFLLAALSSSSIRVKDGNGYMMIYVSSIVKAYKKAVGINLADYDFMDMVLEVELNDH